MPTLNSYKLRLYAEFLNKLATQLTTFYNLKLNKSFKVSNKLEGKGYDPVTTSDKAFEKFIRFKIKQKFPNHQIIGEEFGNQVSKSDFTWIIDPIDGTRSFVIGNPTWSNLISLNYMGSPIMGLVNFPILKKYYLNETDKNAYVFESGKKRKLKVNKDAKFKGIKLTAAFHGNLSFRQQEKISKILQLNNFPTSDALSYMQVAEGRLDVAIQCGNYIWDIHPSIPIIKAAGGVVTNWKNEDAIKAGNIICAANKRLHVRMIKILKPVSK